MLHFVIASAEPSKVPFYIAGAVLVLWAAALAGMGLSNERFPNDQGGERAVIGVTIVLVLIAIGAAVLTSAFPKG